MDDDPIYFWYPSLSDKLGQADKFDALDFVPDETTSLATLIETARLGQFWEAQIVNCLYMSGFNSHFIRSVSKQYPAGVVMGENAVGKAVH